MTKPTKTNDPGLYLGYLADQLVHGTEGFIEGMEAQGQKELVQSDVLPMRIGYDETDADYEALGIVFGETVEDDPIFRHATLPEGWYREGSDHNMWSHIMDETGKERISIFYKAAFYDRNAHMYIVKERQDEVH